MEKIKPFKTKKEQYYIAPFRIYLTPILVAFAFPDKISFKGIKRLDYNLLEVFIEFREKFEK